MDTKRVDEPFHISSPEDLAFDCVVVTPLGDEVVNIEECGHPTRVMSRAEIQRYLDEATPHRHVTVRKMPVVTVG